MPGATSRIASTPIPAPIAIIILINVALVVKQVVLSIRCLLQIDR